MKLSVIFGVFHMCLGIGIKGSNAVYFRKFVVLICEVFAGFFILFGLFGWMDILIFLKWFYPLDIEDRTIINWDELEDQLN
jgi:V-type H+-transporting ATPase subunit a